MAEEIKNPNAEEEYQPDLMTLEDEDGNEVTFEVIDALDHKGVHYMAVVEYAEDEEDVNEDAQLVILSVGEDSEGEGARRSPVDCRPPAVGSTPEVR